MEAETVGNGIAQRILRHKTERESKGLLMIITDNIWSSAQETTEGHRGEDEAKTKLIY